MPRVHTKKTDYGYGFPAMAKILEPTQVGVVKLDHVEVTKERAQFDNMRNIFSGAGFLSVDPGKYARLIVDGKLMMTDTQMERRSNNWFCHKAHGDVLIAGLGIGMVLTRVMAKSEVKSVTVVEKYQDVITAIEPQLLKHFNGEAGKLKIICADIFNWKPEKGKKFNTIYFDIWPDICGDNLPQIAKLHQRFKNCIDRSDPDHYMDSWMRDYLLAERRRENRSPWR